MAARSTTTLTCFLHGPTSRISTVWGSLVATASGAVTESDLVTVPVVLSAAIVGLLAAVGRGRAGGNSDWQCRENARSREVRGMPVVPAARDPKAPSAYRERVMGLEPTTTSLATRYSTTELHPPNAYPK